VIDDWAEIAQG